MGRYAASIVLARAAWETFTYEFIEWRGLSKELKGKSHSVVLKGVFESLETPAPSFRRGTVWYALELVVQLRNLIAHHNATPVAIGELPAGVRDRVSEYRLVPREKQHETWERQLLTSQVAGWCCQAVGEAILSLEDRHEKRRRSIAAVEDSVRHALASLT
jgi:hypothetical protein